MNAADQTAQATFAAALALPRDRRSTYLDQTCAGKDGLRQEIDSLLRAAEQAGDFLHPTIKVTESNFISEISGTRIERCKLLE